MEGSTVVAAVETVLARSDETVEVAIDVLDIVELVAPFDRVLRETSVSVLRGEGCGESITVSAFVGERVGLMKSGHLKLLDRASGLSSPYVHSTSMGQKGYRLIVWRRPTCVIRRLRSSSAEFKVVLRILFSSSTFSRRSARQKIRVSSRHS
jgi:hypothetical protein